MPVEEDKSIHLRVQFAMLIGLICIIYIVADYVNGIYVFIPYYISGVFFSILIYYLNRIGKHIHSSLLLLVITNILVYLFAASDTPENGVFFFFLATTLCSLALLFPEHKILGILFVVLSFVLGLVAYLVDWSALPQPEISEEFIKTNFVINFSVALILCVLIIVFMSKRNEDSKIKLEEKNNELFKLNSELDRFVYSASHDMKAPLTTLLGLINIAKLSNNESERDDIFKLMIDRINVMDVFIKNVTDYSRNTRVETANKKIHLNELIEEVRKENKYLSESAGIEINIRIEDNLVIHSDYNRLKVILNNLVTNSIKYHDYLKENKFITISAEYHGSHCNIHVKDNGLGITEEYQNKIFDMFFRASEKSEGSGLGLYIVKETVEMLNGTISCSSKIDEGTIMTLKIPNVNFA